MKLIENPLNIFDRAVIMKLTIGKPGNVSQIDQSQYQVDAAKDRTRAQKKLLAAPEIDAAGKDLDKCRVLIRKLSNASPLGDGSRLLSILAVPRAEEIIAATVTQLETVHKPKIRELYPTRIKEAKVELNGLFDAADYAPVEQFLAKFYIDSLYLSFGAPQALASVRQDLLTREEEKIRTAAMRTVQDIPVDLATEMKGLTDRLIARTGKAAKGDSIKFKGLLENYLEFLGNLPLRNIMDDADLTELGTRAQQILQGVTSDTLRENTRVRDYVENEMSGIQTKLETIINLRPTRAFEAA